MEDCSAFLRNQSVSILLAPAVANQYTYSSVSLLSAFVSVCSPSNYQTLLLDKLCLVKHHEKNPRQFGSRYRCRSLRYDTLYEDFLSLLTQCNLPGAAAAAALAAEKCFSRIRVFERRETPGGTWIYDSDPGSLLRPAPGHLPPDLDTPVDIPPKLPTTTAPILKERFDQTPIYSELT
jgi:hypothetical protein